MNPNASALFLVLLCFIGATAQPAVAQGRAVMPPPVQSEAERQKIIGEHTRWRWIASIKSADGAHKGTLVSMRGIGTKGPIDVVLWFTGGDKQPESTVVRGPKPPGEVLDRRGKSVGQWRTDADEETWFSERLGCAVALDQWNDWVQGIGKGSDSWQTTTDSMGPHPIAGRYGPWSMVWSKWQSGSVDDKLSIAASGEVVVTGPNGCNVTVTMAGHESYRPTDDVVNGWPFEEETQQAPFQEPQVDEKDLDYKQW